MVVLGDFNARFSNWYKQDKTTHKDSKTDAVVSQFGLQQLIKNPTNILGKLFSCIDLIFSSHLSLVMESSVYHLLHYNCHHQ